MEELNKTKTELEEGIVKANKGQPYFTSLPKDGLTNEQVLSKINTYFRCFLIIFYKKKAQNFREICFFIVLNNLHN